jgi:bifunctional DNA-binding transcriptional regulator/antitoxin component of YhaV-PrlF toxin-antitoxin module
MGFKVIKPSTARLDSNYLGDKVRIGFPVVNKIPQLLMYIGKDIAKKFGLQKGDRVILLVDEERDIWQIKKDIEGYKLGQVNTNLKLQITWKSDIPKNLSQSMQFVSTDVGDGNLQLNVSKPL